MVYIFGIDMPLVETLFIAEVIGLALAIVLIYVMYKVMQINRKMDIMLRQEEQELGEFSEVAAEEKKELDRLRKLRLDMDKIIDEEQDAVKALERMKTVKKEHTAVPEHKKNIADKGKDFIKALLGATMKHDANPVWGTEKWTKEGLVLVKRKSDGSILEWKKHPLSGVPENQLPWKKEHWKPEGDVFVLRRADGTLIDWEKLK